MFTEQKAKELTTAINKAGNAATKLYDMLKLELEVAKSAEEFHKIADAIRKLIKQDPKGTKLTTVNTQIGKLMPKEWKKDGQRGRSEATIEQEKAGLEAAKAVANGEKLYTDAQGGKTAHIAKVTGAYIEGATKLALIDKPADKIGSTVVTVVRRAAKDPALAEVIGELVAKYQKVQPTPADDAEQRLSDGLAKAQAAADAINKPKRGRRKTATAKA
tara:strand:+ start:3066 stop:3716 length:651 start_codon:yes stop_codon:yes gene_type:complete